MSTIKQDFERQIHALEAVGIEAPRMYVDKNPGPTDRPGLRTALAHTRTGDVLVVHTLNLIHDLA